MFTLDVCVCVYVNVKFNIVSMETQTQMHRMGLNPFLMFSIETMFFDVDANTNANANVKCEHSLKDYLH